ncbi:hypothetical protein PtA15_18A442 [Puccinia triticina]|uniref:Uncharacterized protein n=1 Tax=Puccinia triticina TaxID=208348 RepID=A0ABY7D6S7_9BASI|nr:uncharacterized protein PtA15_18A442 [Puccinia triticina]WAQ93381.1 hypothetical protein PtA15_18A442 [Puccinia triticina]
MRLQSRVVHHPNPDKRFPLFSSKKTGHRFIRCSPLIRLLLDLRLKMRPPTFAQGHAFSHTCPQPLYSTPTTGSQQTSHNGGKYQHSSTNAGYQNSNHSSLYQSTGQLTSNQQTGTPTGYPPRPTVNNFSTDPTTTYQHTCTCLPHPNSNHRPTDLPAPTYNYNQGSSAGPHLKPTPPNHIDLSNDSPSPENTTRTGYYVFPDYPSIDYIDNLLRNPNLSYADRFLLEAAQKGKEMRQENLSNLSFDGSSQRTQEIDTTIQVSPPVNQSSKSALSQPPITSSFDQPARFQTSPLVNQFSQSTRTTPLSSAATSCKPTAKKNRIEDSLTALPTSKQPSKSRIPALNLPAEKPATISAVSDLPANRSIASTNATFNSIQAWPGKTAVGLEAAGLTLRLKLDHPDISVLDFCGKPSDMKNGQLQRILTAFGAGEVELINTNPKEAPPATLGADLTSSKRVKQSAKTVKSNPTTKQTPKSSKATRSKSANVKLRSKPTSKLDDDIFETDDEDEEDEEDEDGK